MAGWPIFIILIAFGACLVWMYIHFMRYLKPAEWGQNDKNDYALGIIIGLGLMFFMELLSWYLK